MSKKFKGILDEVKFKIMFGTAVPAIIMVLLAGLGVFVVYLMQDKRNVKSLEVGETVQLVSTLDTSIEGIEWKSSDVNVATVDSTGLVRGISPGDVDVKLTIDSEVIDEYRVIVYTYNEDGKQLYNPVTKLDISSKENNLYVGDKLTLTAKVTPDDATNKELHWESSNQNIATVNQHGEVTAVNEGTVDITVKSINNVEATAKINVSRKKATPAPVTQTVKASEIVINEGTGGSFKPGLTKQLTTTILPENTTDKTVTWKSNNPKVAKVDSNGKVTTNAIGVAIITATTSNGKTNKYIMTVSKNVNPELVVNKTNVSTNVGNNIQLYASNNTGSAITYKSSNTSIATVDKNGKVTTKRTGNVTITVSSDNINKKVNISILGYRVHYINTGTFGDAILLESNGKYGMIDVGPTEGGTIVKAYLDSLNIKQLEFIIFSHPHVDHNGAMQYLLNSGLTVNTIYQKEYTYKDSSAYNGVKNTLNRVNNIINTATKSGTKFVYVDKSFKEGQSINLGDMKIYFYNNIQRILYERKDGDVFNYETSQYWATHTENVNSIVNLITVNNHSLLSTADMNSYRLYSNILNRVYKITPRLDVYKIGHHAYHNCTGDEELIIPASYYIVTNSIDDKYGDGGYIISNDIVSEDGEQFYSCFHQMHLNMCDAYYSLNSTKSIIVNFSNSNVSLSGGGLGRNSSSRCR